MQTSYRFFHRTPIQIRFNDVDIMGHVNNSVYQNYFDYARLRYFEEVFGYRIDWFDKALVLVKIEIEYQQPVQMFDEIGVLTKIFHLGNKSLQMEQLLVGNEQQDVRCSNRAVLSAFSYHEGKAVELPERWRRAIAQYEHDLSF